MTMVAKLPDVTPAFFGTDLASSNAALTSAFAPDVDGHQTSPRPFSACDTAFDRNGSMGRLRIVRKDPACRTCAFRETPSRSLY
jgi:hypothetical protein